MHELSLCEGVVQILEEQARIQSYSRVKTVWLEVGVLAGVELESLRFSFDAVTRGTLAEGARLEILSAPGRAKCLSCGETVVLNERFSPCPRCGGYPLQVTSGEELRIKELEVE
ncbi:hydrogenase maturation nickel metallochaperone HypA [Nitrosococcus wardiae]|uniref:Hydrogenase maturation factor HypA n=1 Tax=Nitrosococcus wardiae TaxID=1814290 RepID=A0A4P7C4R5_9GAMM|nr:hydrogenase maturation nickel metallochaperone HypA [Nitrosococcus wardiae]QBQ55936.1 hydrogenase maturation nickel metallochaperone HypA [Nitrosococcus wardiae]